MDVDVYLWMCMCLLVWMCVAVGVYPCGYPGKGEQVGGGGRKDFSAVIICVMGFIFKSSMSVYYFALNAFEVA